MDTDFILQLARAALASSNDPRPSPEPEPEVERGSSSSLAGPASSSVPLRFAVGASVVLCHQDKAMGLSGVAWQASLALSYAMG